MTAKSIHECIEGELSFSEYGTLESCRFRYWPVTGAIQYSSKYTSFCGPGLKSRSAWTEWRWATQYKRIRLKEQILRKTNKQLHN